MDEMLVAAVAGALSARASAFLDEVLKPSGELIGGKLRDRIFAQRAGRVADVVTRASEMASAAGFEAQAVPGRILWPVLEHASLEDEPELVTQWAALLANSASPTSANRILPAFIDILRQLTPQHARLIRRIAELEVETPHERITQSAARSVEKSNFRLSPLDYELLATDLHRMQILDGVRWIPGANPSPDTKAAFDRLGGDDWRAVGTMGFEYVNLTSLGRAFVKACTPPG